MITQTTVRRGARSLLAALAALLLAACTGTGSTLGPNEAYLTLSNPNDATAGTFTYNQIFIDNTQAKNVVEVAAAQNVQIPVTIGQHQFTFVFNEQPTGTSTPTQTTVGPVLINVPTNGCTFTGPTPTQPYSSGC